MCEHLVQGGISAHKEDTVKKSSSTLQVVQPHAEGVQSVVAACSPGSIADSCTNAARIPGWHVCMVMFNPSWVRKLCHMQSRRQL
jgi:hypothetical protein